MEHNSTQQRVDFENKLSYWQRLNALERGRNDVLSMAARGEAMSATLNALCEQAQVYSPEMFCSVLRLDETQGTLHPLASYGISEEYCQALDGVQIGLGVGSCGTAAFSKERVIVEDINTHPYWSQYKDLALSAGLQACWSEPIKGANDRVFGTFAMYYREPKSPSKEDLHFIEVSANLAALVFENNENKMQLTEANRKLQQSLDNRTRELEQTNQELQAALKGQKDKFINNISIEKMQTTKSLVIGIAHEISTPVGNAMMATGLVEKKIADFSDYVDANKSLKRSDIVNLLKSVDEAMDINRLSLERVAQLLEHFKQVDTQGRHEPKSNFELRTFFDEFKASMSGVLGPHNLELHVDDAGVTLRRQSLTQVLFNLVENSVIHGFGEQKQGMINITATVKDGELVINYQDNGVGIDQELNDKIFEPFFVKNRNRDSIGLGLNIISNIVRQSLKGQILLMKSPANAGARFEIRVPQALG